MKLPWLFIVTIFILLGCNENTSDDEFTIEDIVNKSIEVMEAVDSYTFEMDSQQIMNLTDTEHVNLYSQLKMDLVTVPLTFYQQTSINSELLGETVYYQTYYSEEEGLFMEDPFSNDWAKYPEVLVTEILNDSEEHIHPKGQLVPL
ncbi:MAG: hypothetical protein LRY73_10800 [Bacillus sp. (in: Bacteria)]|nr:hypothetical protein [Bacillus sp. (in: firmicutes)]